MTTPDENEDQFGEPPEDSFEEEVLEEDEDPVEDNWTPRVGCDPWAARLREEGGEWKEFHPAYVCLRRPRSGFDEGSRGIYAQKATLSQLSRIEALRWESLLKSKRLSARWGVLYEDVYKAGGECFIPPDSPSIYSIKGRTPKEDPRRVKVSRSDSFEVGGYTSTYDDDFFTYRPTKHNGAEMEVIASAAEEGEWEQIIYPKRLARANNPAKLDMGRRWRHMEIRQRGILDRSGLLHELLKTAIQMTGILPRGTPHFDRIVLVQINGRKYPFTVTGGDYVKADFDKWPRPDDPPDVVVEGPFKLDDSLLGKMPDVVRSRLGEPHQSDGLVWRYPTGTVTFKVGHYGTVIGVDQTPNDIPPPAPSPAPGRDRGRAVQEPSQGRTSGRARCKDRPARREGVAGEATASRKTKGSRARKARQAT